MKTENYLNIKDENSIMKKSILIFFTLLFMLSSAFANEELIRWQFEEGSGSVILDTSGNSNYGSVIGGRWQTGADAKFGTYGFDFDNNNDYIKLIPPYLLTENHTISLWVKPDRDNEIDTFWYIYDDTTPLDMRFTYLDDVSSDWAFIYNGTDGLEHTIIVDSFLPTTASQWYNTILAFNFETDELYYYRDSALIFNITLNVSPDVTTSSNTEFILGGTDVGQYYDGDMDEFRVYDYTFNETDANDILTNQLPTGVVTPGDGDGSPTEPEIIIEGVELANIINSTSPSVNGEQVTNNINLLANLNLQADCDIYVDNDLYSSVDNIIAYNQDATLSVSNHTYLVYCSYVGNDNILYYDVTETITFEVIEGTPSTINFVISSNQFDVNSQSLYALTPCLDTGIIIPSVTKPYNRLANPQDVYFEKLDNGQATFVLPPTNHEFCLINGIAQYNLEDNFSDTWQVNNVINQMKLGDYDIPSNVTTTFFVGLETNDLYKVTNPKWWGTSWVEIIGGLILLVIGLVLIAIGVEMKEPKAIVMGALLTMFALGFQISTIVLGVLT